MRTSLIVSTYNWPQALACCLASIARQSRLPDEVIVADDGSREDTAECIRGVAGDFPVSLHHAWQEDRGFRLARSADPQPPHCGRDASAQAAH